MVVSQNGKVPPELKNPGQDLDSERSSQSSAESVKPNCLQRCGGVLSNALERAFYNLGAAIAKRPVITIACVLLAYLLCAAGLVKFYEVDPSDPIWVDQNSEYIRDKEWVTENFPSSLRVNFLIAESDKNLLEPPAVMQLYNIHETVIGLMGNDYIYTSLCAKLGTGASAPCWSSSILELWNFEGDVIKNLTKQEIIDKINTTNTSPFSKAPFDASLYLGSIETDIDGKIVSAKAAMINYYMKSGNTTDEPLDKDNPDEITEAVQAWEEKFVEMAKKYSNDYVSKLQVLASRSFGDEIGTSIFGDVYKLSAGYMIIILYVCLVLGRFNCMEQRIWLSLAVVLGVGLSIAVSFGLSSAFGIGYGPVQSILPFLLLGLGVDDGFVIVQAWNCLTPAERKKPLTEQAGNALKHAGVSITVTSITDFIAFGIGATTVLPALRDFCIYAAIGIIALFIVQATFFMACVVIDEKRRAANRNACCCCYIHSDAYTPSDCSKRDLQQTFFDKYYGPTLIKLPVKIVVVVISLALLALGIYGVVFLKQEYDPNSFIPTDSYLKDYVNAYEKHFPNQGIDSGYLYLSELSYFKEADKIEELTAGLELEKSVAVDSLDSWISDFIVWLNNTKCPWVESHLNPTTRWPLDERRFNMLLTPFLYMTSAGRRHIRNVKFNETVSLSGDMGNLFGLQLNDPKIIEMEEEYAARHLIATRIPFSFVDLQSSSERVGAMDDTRELVASYYKYTDVFVYSESFSNWETDKIVQHELYRNMGLAFGCVLVLTLLLIADIGACLLVSLCVLATLVEVGGFMYFWDLTIDTVTCIQLVLAIGLAVDYSAHIGHSYMTVTGNRNVRTVKTLSQIGPAVFNGGFSTFLAFVLLASSSSYVFDVFFKINLLVVCLGLWNGMILLPVLLSWIGPSPYFSVVLYELNESQETAVTEKHELKSSNSAHQNMAYETAGEDNLPIAKPNDVTVNDIEKHETTMTDYKSQVNGSPIHANGVHQTSNHSSPIHDNSASHTLPDIA